MINLPLSREHLSKPLLLSTIALLLWLAEPLSSQWLELVIRQHPGEFWRVLTTNFLHSNGIHLALNCGGIVLIWLAHAEHYSHKTYWSLLIFCSLAVGSGMLVFEPYTSYVGLSGALHGMIAWGAVKDAEKGWLSGWLILGGVIAKVANENMSGASEQIASLINTQVAVESHLYGLIAGLIAAIPAFISILRRSQQNTDR